MTGQKLEITTVAQLAYYIRGEVLDHFILIENQINIIIANEFCNDTTKLNDAISILFDLGLQPHLKS
jgi:hypothetical protein